MTAPIPLVDQLACAKRELRLRRNVYPEWTRKGRISKDTAALELARMEAIVATLEELAAKEPPAAGLPLFAG